MMRKLGLLEERQAEEEALCAAEPKAKALLARLAEVYGALEKANTKAACLEGSRGLYHGSALLFVGHTLHEASVEAKKDDTTRETAYRERNRPFLAKRLQKR